MRTVLGDSTSRRAMVRLSCPRATRSSTSRSRSVSLGEGDPRDRPTGRQRRHGPCGDRRPEDDVTVGDRAHGPLDLVGARALEQVAPGPDAHARCDGVVVLAHRHDEDASVGIAPHDLAGRLDPGVRSEVEVHEDDVDLGQRQGQGLGRITRLPHDADAVERVEQARHAHPEDGVVVHDGHGEVSHDRPPRHAGGRPRRRSHRSPVS